MTTPTVAGTDRARPDLPDGLVAVVKSDCPTTPCRR